MVKHIEIKRQWLGTGTNGKVETYTEQRYISKHSGSYYDLVNLNAYKESFKQEYKVIDDLVKKDDFKELKQHIQDSDVFTFSDSTNGTPKKGKEVISLQQISGKRCNISSQKLINGAHLSLSGNSHLGAEAPKDDIARQILSSLRAWAEIIYPSLLNERSSTVSERERESNNNESTSKVNTKKHQNTSSNEVTTITALSVVLSIDFEWQLGHQEQTATGEVLTHTQKRRDFGDVLSVQYAMFLPDYPNVKIHGIIFNNNDKGFNFRALMLKFVDIIQKEFHALDHNQRPIVLNLKKLKLLLTGYFLGVDFSCMTGWNKLPIKLTVLGKHRIFSRIPYKFMLRRRKGAEPVTVTMTIRDTASIAPMGGLKELGEIVGQPKIDVTKQDAIDFATHKIGLADYCRYLEDGGYYKNHMKVLQERHFKLYCDYALNDSIVALKYLKMFMKVFGIDWSSFRNVPITTTNYAATAVANALKDDCIDQRIYNPEISFAEARKDPLNSCRDSYRDLYAFSTKSYFGGFNVSFCSVVLMNVIVVDTDLKSSYPQCAALMARPNYNAPHSLNDLTHLFTDLVSIDENSHITFEELYASLQKGKGFPFVLGTAKVSITYPKNYQGIIMTPQRSPKTNNPTYTKQLKNQYVTLVDAIDAYEHGATVSLHSAEIPAQDWNHYNAWADVQLNFVSIRQKAKKQRDLYDNGSNDYQKYDAEQTLYKLCSNVIYGASAQAVLPKNTRDYLTNKTTELGISKVTDPVIACAYTSITRYLCHHLYDAVSTVYQDNVLPLNVTTDGYTFALNASCHSYNNDSVLSEYNSHLPSFYHERLKKIDFETGYERKGDTSDTPTQVFNVRTRLNGTPSMDSLAALGGIQDMTVKQVYDLIMTGQPTLINHARRYSNLTAMKFANDKRANHHAGVMFEWRQDVNVPLQYDCSYKPNKWISPKWQGFGFSCIPFDTVEDHDVWKAHSKLISDRWTIGQSQQQFNDYLATMDSYSFSRTAKTLDSPDYQDRVNYVLSRISGKSIPTQRKYKNTLYTTQNAIRNGTKLPICIMAKYHNWTLD